MVGRLREFPPRQFKIPSMSLPAFNRVLARHLAQALTSGAACDQDLLAHCYTRARHDCHLHTPLATDPLAQDVRLLCMAQDLRALKQNQARLRRLPLPEAEAEIFRLLNPDLHRVGVEIGYDVI